MNFQMLLEKLAFLLKGMTLNINTKRICCDKWYNWFIQPLSNHIRYCNILNVIEANRNNGLVRVNGVILLIYLRIGGVSIVGC